MTGILVDENVPKNVREWLKNKGLNITFVSETNLRRAKDFVIAEYAAKNNMTILTLDTDFAQIYHTLKKGTLSVILLKPIPATASNTLQALMMGSEKVDLRKTENKLIIISNKKIRIVS